MQNQQERQKLQVWKTLFPLFQQKGGRGVNKVSLELRAKLFFVFTLQARAMKEEEQRKPLSKKIDRKAQFAQECMPAEFLASRDGNAGSGLALQST